jgi:hypothetical protein
MRDLNQKDQLCYVMSKLFDIPDLLNNETFKDAVDGIFQTGQPDDVLIDHLFPPQERAKYSSPKPWTFGNVFLESCGNDLKVAQNIISGINTRNQIQEYV